MFTIGHSNHSIETFLEMLDSFAITCVADVRSAPYSRHNPQFNRETLQRSLKGRGIAYVFLGKELGARTEQDDCYIDGKVSFDRLSATELFRSGLARLREGDKSYTIALMCAEKEPLNCHRTILVARNLTAMGIEIEHILGPGEAEAHEDTVERLIDLVKLERDDLFSSHDDLVELAFRLREGEVAYTLE